MAKKLYDLAAKTGEYLDSNGKTKGRWQNVGAVMANDDGGKFIMLDRTFNPAGIPNPDNRSTVLLSMFEPREHDGGSTGGSDTTQRRPPAPSQHAPIEEDEIPF